MKIIRRLLLLLLFAFIIAQFFGPEKNQGEISSVELFLAETAANEEIVLILKESCFDCHSDHTRYPWYSKITPVNYWMDDHVRHGKGDFNASKWADYSDKKKDHKLEEIEEMVADRSMPIDSYLWTHKEAELNEEQIAAVSKWVENARLKYQLTDRPQ